MIGWIYGWLVGLIAKRNGGCMSESMDKWTDS